MKTRKLRIAADLALPLDTITSTLVVYGGKGMGKTNFASVLVEEIDANGLRFAFLDPVGVSWGLRHSVDGKGRGIELLILGGTHGDIPIEPTGGAVVADLVVDESVNVLIDISRHPSGSMWSIGERVRFVTDYCKRLYQRQGEKRQPLMQIIDEAARFAPQTVRKGEEQVAACMGAIAVLVEEGRNVGIGVALLTLRSARLNKDVAELADCLIAFRTVGPNSRAAVLDWLGAYVEKERLRELDNTVRKLPIGSALIVSPGWLGFEGVVALRARQTFDSSKTPKPGQQVRATGQGAKPDLPKYQERMAETIERAKENDPKELKKQIADLNRKLAAKSPAIAPAARSATNAADIARAVTAAKREAAEALEKSERAHRARFDRLRRILGRATAAHAELASELSAEPPAAAASTSPAPMSASSRASHAPRAPAPTPHHAKSPARSSNVPSTLPPGERAILIVCAQYPDGATREQLTVLTGYKRSTRDAYIQRLREKGYVEVGTNVIIATDGGIAVLGDGYSPLPTGATLRQYWLDKLPSGERAIFACVLDAYPKVVERSALDEATGFKRSTRDAYLQRLQVKRIVTTDRGEVRASDVLFQE